jgi:predicted transcriptional regulator
MAELPIDLRKLEPVGSAFDILTYLHDSEDHAADGDVIMEDLDISSRRFDKAKRRLVTTGYIQMRTDGIYELTRKGLESAEILANYEGKGDGGAAGVQRQVLIVLPRNLVYGQSSPLQIAIAPSDEFQGQADLILRVQATYAKLGDIDEMVKLGGDKFVLDTTITPEAYDQARVKLELYQLDSSGEDLTACGGLYVDITVLPSGKTGEMIAYSADATFPQ